jgi:hypothetical protein
MIDFVNGVSQGQQQAAQHDLEEHRDELLDEHLGAGCAGPNPHASLA